MLAAAEPSREVCGLLLGTASLVADILPAANLANDPDRRFEVDPAVHFAAIRAARTGGAKVIGNYHSHPGGSASPSATDAAMIGSPGEIWLIVAGDTVVAWRAGDGRFDAVELMVNG